MKFNLDPETEIQTRDNGGITAPLFLFMISLGVFIADRLTKLLVQYFAPEAVSVNHGLSFSIPASQPVVAALLIVGAGVLIALSTRINIYQNMRTMVAAGLFIGGAASNVYDRLHFGGVLDIFRISVSHFNLADLTIIAGSTIILIDFFRTARAKKRE